MLASVLVLVLVGVGIAWWQFSGFERVDFDPGSAREVLEREGPREDPEEHDGEDSEPDEQPRVEIERDDELLTVLILGSDAREGLGGARADVIMLGIIPPDGDPVLGSIPRDLWVSNPCTGGMGRINGGLNGCGRDISGPELMSIMVEDLAGIEIDHYVEVEFDGFVTIVDTFGGVEVCTDHPVRAGEVSLPGGCAQASGEEALAWARSRRTQEYVDGRWRTMPGVNALTRDDRQQEIVLEIAGEISRFDSIGELRSVISGLKESVTLDSGMTLTRSVGLAWQHRDLDMSDVQRVTIPVTGFTTSGGAQVLRADRPVHEVFAEALDMDPGELAGNGER